MLRSREDRQFARFVRTADPGALAEVFDQTAPELLRVAVHLCRGDRHQAEDAVQTAFVTAIERAADWDPSQRVLPWLLGIVSNRVRHQRRQERRRPEVERLAPRAPAEDASEAAVRHELDVALQRAVDRAPGTYRELLALHVLQGLSAAEIAARLGRQAGVVRMQLHRGLDHLRRALPAGFAAGAVVTCQVSAAAQAALRARVLATAAGHAPRMAAAAGVSGASAGLLGVLLMKKTVLVISGLGAVLALALLLEPWGSPAAVPETGEAAAPASAIVTAGANEVAAAAADRSLAPAASAVRAPAAPPRGTVLVRVRWAEGGAALEGIELRLAGAVGPDDRRTDHDGVARFDRVPAGTAWLTLARTDLWPASMRATVPAAAATRGVTTSRPSAAGRAGAGQPVEVVADAETVVELALPTRVRARLRVLDPELRPIVGARVLARRNDGRDDRMAQVGVTDARGEQLLLSYDRMLARVEAAGFAASDQIGLESAERLAEGEVQDREVVLQPAAPPLRGLVRDVAGQPVAGARVTLQQLLAWPRHGARQATTSDAAGRFVCEHLAPGSVLVVAGVERAGRSERGAAYVEVSPSAPATVEVVVGRGATVRGVVRGAPEAGPDSTVSALWNDVRVAFDLQRELVGRGAVGRDGHYRIDGLMPGRYELRYARGDAAVTAEVELVEGQEHVWNPQLEQAQQLQLLVVDDAGAPLDGWNVQAYTDEAPMIRVATTAADGRCTVTDLTTAPYRVVVAPPGLNLPALTIDRMLPGPQEQRVVVPASRRPTAAVRGRLVAGAGLQLGELQLVLFAREGAAQPLAIDPESGAFELEDVPGGDYALLVQRGQRTLHYVEERALAPGAVLDYGDVVVACGTLRIEVVDEAGRVLPDPQVAFAVAEQLAPLRGGVRRDGATWFDTMPALPFDLVVSADGMAPQRHPVRITPESTVDLRVVLRPGVATTLALRLGDPPRYQQATVRDAGNSAVFSTFLLPAGEDGRVPLRLSLAPGRYQLVLTAWRWSVASATTHAFEVTDQPAEVEITAR